MNKCFKLIFSILVLFFLFCSAQKIEISRNIINQNINKNTVLKNQNSENSGDSFQAPPLLVPIKNWIGLSFLVLEKQGMFCQKGYELFNCFKTDSCSLTDTIDILNQNNRVPCDELRGHTLLVKEVKESGSEYLVRFYDMLTKKVIIGKTYKLAIKEIVSETDLIWAKKHWQNRFVFSRKGVISILLKEKNNLGSQKVRIQDSLRVIDVVAGLTPLPVNPIWLVVKTPQGQEGILPIRSSWTNTMSDKVKNGNAWIDDILEEDPTKVFSWDEGIWEIINNHRVILDMTRDQVLMSWGEPLKREMVEYHGETHERWSYAAQVLYFGQNQLIAIEDVQ